MSPNWCCIIACLLLPVFLPAQEPGKIDQVVQLPEKFLPAVNKKITALQNKLSAQSEKYLRRFAKKEKKLQGKLTKVDSTAAKNLFSNSQSQYLRLLEKIKSKSSTGKLSSEYFPYADSLGNILSFIDQNKTGLTQKMQQQATAVSDQFKRLQGQFSAAEEVKQFIRERKQQIGNAMARYTNLPGHLTRELTDFKKEVYYYSQQVREYKQMLNDPDKLTKTALSLATKVPAFRDFMKQHSQLAGLFGVPAGYGNVSNLAGLQTRAQVQSLIQSQLGGANGQQMLQQNLQAAQAELSKFKEKLKQLGNGSGDIEMPDFKPNNQRTKNFLKRLEFGTNLQSTKSGYFFPTTTDFGLSVGYRINDKSTIGIGGSYKVGWGKDIKNIVVTGQGAGVRSFLDVKIKGSFYASGGFEYNYQPIDTAGINLNVDWTSSGLVGISKIVSLKTKFFKRTKLQLLWDFMSYKQVPRTEAIKFRVGYNF